MLAGNEIGELLKPYLGSVKCCSDGGSGDSSSDFPVDWLVVREQLAVYLELLLKWNARMNLTAIRKPEEIVRRHFGESLFAGTHLGQCGTLLDLGSGAGFPGVPIQLMRPDVKVTLAESQGKKAAFLREVVRELGLQTEVWAARVETMPVERGFDSVAMRAVDNMGAAVREGWMRTRVKLLILRSSLMLESEPELIEGFRSIHELPQSSQGVLLIIQK